MKTMLKVLKWIGIVILIIVVLVALLLVWLSKQPSVPNDYTDTVKTGGELEAKYLSMGEYEVSYFESDAMMSFQKYEIYYPTDIATFDNPLPVVVFVNGTGVGASKYPALLKHMASWGFIAIGTEEEYAWNGFSAEMCVRYLEFLNDYKSEDSNTDNVFFGKVDLDRVGITGHSQGGFGVVNAITVHRHADSYKAAVILSSNAQTNPGLQWEADATQITTPTMIIGSTGQSDAMLASPDSLQMLYEQIPDDVEKLLALRNDADHGQTSYYADGYVTAWFMYWLQGDEDAGNAIWGENAEIVTNPLYQNTTYSEGAEN